MEQNTSHTKTIEEMKNIFRTFQSMENVHDIAQKAHQEGKLTSRQINTLMRSIKVFEWNALNPAKQHLMFKSETDFEESINDSHKRMIKLTDSLGSDGEKYLKEWNKIYDAYRDLIQTKIEILKKEIEAKKAQSKRAHTLEAEKVLEDL